MAVGLTEHACLVLERFVDSVLIRAKAGEISRATAENEIAVASAMLLRQHPDAVRYMEVRGGRVEDMPGDALEGEKRSVYTSDGKQTRSTVGSSPKQRHRRSA